LLRVSIPPAQLCNAELNISNSISQAGVPDAIPAQSRYLDWQELLTLLAKLVEAQVPGQRVKLRFRDSSFQ
jgi:hypothetical protein